MRRRVHAKVPHQLHPGLDDIGHIAVRLGVRDAVVGLVRLGKLREFAVGPVKFAAVHNHAPHLNRVAVHVFGGGMDNNIRAELEGLAQNRRGKGVIHNQGDAHLVGNVREALNVQHGEGRVGNGFAKDQLGVGLKGGLDFLIRGGAVHINALNAQLFQGEGKQVDGAPIDGGQADNAVPSLAEVENGQQGGGLAGGGAHGAHAPLQVGNFVFHRHNRGVAEAGVAQALGGIVKNGGYLGGGVVHIGGALYNGQHPGLAVAGGVARVQAFGFVTHIIFPHFCFDRWMPRRLHAHIAGADSLHRLAQGKPLQGL